MTQQTNRQKWTWVTVASHSAFVRSIPVLVTVKLALTVNPWSQSHPEHSNYFQACLIRFHSGQREDRNYAELVRWNLPTQCRWCRSIQLKWLYVVGWNNSLVSTMNDVTEEEEDKEMHQVLNPFRTNIQTITRQTQNRNETVAWRGISPQIGNCSHSRIDWQLFQCCTRGIHQTPLHWRPAKYKYRNMRTVYLQRCTGFRIKTDRGAIGCVCFSTGQSDIPLFWPSAHKSPLNVWVVIKKQ